MNMDNTTCKLCSHCKREFSESFSGHHCEGCTRLFCDDCSQENVSSFNFNSNGNSELGLEILSGHCCSDSGVSSKAVRQYSNKIHPSLSSRQSPDPASPYYYRPSLQELSVYASPCRSEEDEEEDSGKRFLSPCSLDTSDIDSISVSTRHEFYSFTSVGSSPSDSPSRVHCITSRVRHSVQEEEERTPRVVQQNGTFCQETMAVLKNPELGTEPSENTYDDLAIFRDQCKKLHKPLDFEKNGLIWFPPAPLDENDEKENNFFTYVDEDDEMGGTITNFSSSDNSLCNMSQDKGKQNEDYKENLRSVIQRHFRALVLQLLQGESIEPEDWLEIITSLAWQAANFVKPDTSRGGSMDPSDYVKIKCIASGTPLESTFIKGVVCTKNIKHKRMASQLKNPRLLILGGALEYQRTHNQLASFNTLLQQEIDHLKTIVSRIEAQRPNVLLVEKSVSSYALDDLLTKDISLVLNVKRPLLERIARCTGALITPSVDKIATTRLGHCEVFRLEKFSEEHEVVNQLNKKPSKTLMFFEGCARRLGCTILLKGSCLEELEKVKHVVQYAFFAGYHLSLETSFLVDEGATLPKMTVPHSIVVPDWIPTDSHASSSLSVSVVPSVSEEIVYSPCTDEGPTHLNLDTDCNPNSPWKKGKIVNSLYHELGDDYAANVALDCSSPLAVPSAELQAILIGGESQMFEPATKERLDEHEAANECYSATDNHQSILVSFSSRCVLNGTVCERSRLLRIKFYGSFDKPLGRYLRDDLFERTPCCHACKEPAEAHVICYTHKQGNLTINVRCLPTVKLAGEKDGKIWMWHRCLRCDQIDGVPPATHRVVMSDAAWGLSFGKFLDLSFSNHATANRVASCGHSLKRDCLRFYGFGSMVAFFRYSPIDILSVHLPPSMLMFNVCAKEDWLRKEAAELLSKTEDLYEKIEGMLEIFEKRSAYFEKEFSEISKISNHIVELKDLLLKERNNCTDLLRQECEETSERSLEGIDIFDLNHLRHSLVIGLQVWDRRLHSLEFLLGRSSNSNTSDAEAKYFQNDKRIDNCLADDCNKKLQSKQEDEVDRISCDFGILSNHLSTSSTDTADIHRDEVSMTALERAPSAASVFSDKIDSAWTGATQLRTSAHLDVQQVNGTDSSMRQTNQTVNQQYRRVVSPARVNSFDSALRNRERNRKILPSSSMHFSSLKSFSSSGDYSNMFRDPLSSVYRTYSLMLPSEVQKVDLLLKPSFISFAPLLPEGVHLMIPHGGRNDLVVAVYDDEPTSIITYALASKEYEEWVNGTTPTGLEGERVNLSDSSGHISVTSSVSAWQSLSSLDYIHYGSYVPEDGPTSIGSFFSDPKSSPHLKISFEDESSCAEGKVKFSVTCYFAKEFDALREKCCPSEVDFMRSLSRCKRWSAQGGKSNVYFAKSLDERFMIKQVTKIELESFMDFALEYFKYLTDSLTLGCPTCLAKIIGIYQVTVKHLRGGKEAKMDVMVMENLFYKRSISTVYDLKGSERSRYNSDKTGTNKTLLDLNLIEALRTKPIFLGSKAKRVLERAVWNDTSFLASIDVMDYSLLVGVDEEKKELVLGIIDFLRQYTWDKHLETWVKASGILGGPKNALPTIVSPKQYKRRFRKAMTTYFLTVPDQWSL